MPAHRTLSTRDLQLLDQLMRSDDIRLLLIELLRPRLNAMPGASARPAQDAARVLTRRQVELLRMVAGGRTNRQIAHSLGIAEGTVRKHLENAYARLGVDNRIAAVDRVFGAWQGVSAP